MRLHVNCVVRVQRKKNHDEDEEGNDNGIVSDRTHDDLSHDDYVHSDGD